MRRLLIPFLVLALLVPGAAAVHAAKPGKKQKQAPAKPAGPPKLDASAWILVDPRDDTVLAANAPDKELPIASTTKLMTAYLALENLKPKQKLRAPRYNTQDAESILGLRVGEKMSVRDLLYALVLQSANDAAETFADGVSGSVPAFVNEMNAAAQRLGLTETHYSTPVGLDTPGNHSSARDLVKLASILLRNKLFAKAADSASATLKTGDAPRHIVTRNLLLNSEPFVTGVKTGHTLDAGYVLVGAGKQHGTTLISAVLGTPSEAARDADTLELLDYGFSQYTPRLPVRKGAELASPELSWRGDHLPLVAARAVPVDIRTGQVVGTKVASPSEVDGPIDRGQKLGRVVVTVDGRAAGSAPLVAAEPVAKATLLDKVKSIVLNPVFLLLVGLIVILVGVILHRRGHGGDDEPPRPRRKRRLRPHMPHMPRSAEERERMREERMRRRRSKTP